MYRSIAKPHRYGGKIILLNNGCGFSDENKDFYRDVFSRSGCRLYLTIHLGELGTVTIISESFV
jgi:hypothetical protein